VPFEFDSTFSRQRSAEPSQIGLVIPQTAQPGVFIHQFHYVKWPVDPSLLTDDAVIDTGSYTIKVRDAVVGVFDLARWAHYDFCWSFSSNAQRDVLAALRIGQTFDVQFDEPLEEAFHVIRYHFPSGVPNSGYGEYAVHLGVDPPRPDRLRIVSSFEPQSRRTESRLPFFFGFRVFGMAVGSERPPVWRELLAAAVRQAAYQQWAHCLLYTAFSLESFIDRQLANRLRAANLGEAYIDHVLQVGERRTELSALNFARQRVSKSTLNKLIERLNLDVFTPRNRVAHGRLADREISADQAITALKTTVEFIWDWDDTSRPLLLAPLRQSSFETMIDQALLDTCTNAGN
jgi:hypothetical protein